jgi:Asp-tRNA(Asn)/Glu-tRNA(Gln) amidotransferase C subunit
MKEKYDIERFFSISKLIKKPLHLDSVIEMLNKIKEVDVSNEVVYDKEWIKMKTREDIVEKDNDIIHFGKKKDGFFVVDVVMKG